MIGTGGAAMAAGIEARSRGKNALLLEHGPLGGVCLALMAQKQELLDRLRKAKYADVADAHGFPITYGHAKFIDEALSTSAVSTWPHLRSSSPPGCCRTSRTCSPSTASST